MLSFVLSAFLSFSTVPAPRADVHVIIETERAYMGAVTKSQVEYWLGPKTTWTSQRGRVVIVRRDLGVRWRLDPAKKTYVEEKLAETPPAPPDLPADDIHSARFGYEPEYDWALEPAGRATVAGRDCRAFVAHGEADYAETDLRFAIGERLAVETVPDVNQLLVDQARWASVQRFLTSVVRGRENGCLMSYEETNEPAIAPTIVMRAKVTLLDVGEAPPKIYEVPEGFTKAPSL
jgi:hypothetical protein